MVRDLLYPGSKTRIWAHVETPFKIGKRPVNQDRYLYDSDDPKAVAVECERAVEQGIQAFMYNSYAKGSFEDKARLVWFAAAQHAGLNQLINVDGANITSLVALQAYIAYTKSCIEKLTNYETWNGKPVVTYFCKTGTQVSWLREIEKENPDLCFVYNGPQWGHNQMAWIEPDLIANLEWFCKTYAAKKDGLYVPCVFAGFNDNLNGHQVWNNKQPPRIWPAEGPNAATWAQCFQAINRHYSGVNPLPVLQIVTWNDLDEGTGVCRGIPRL